MEMTIELARRIQGRKERRQSTPMTDSLRLEILMDWLEGMPYREIQPKHGVSKSAICKVVRQARKEAAATLQKTVRTKEAA